MHQTHHQDETQRITGLPRRHSRRRRIAAMLLAALALGLTPLAWRAKVGNTFEPAFLPRLGPMWRAPQGIRPQSGVVLQCPKGERTLAWVDLEGSVHAENAGGKAFPPLLGVKGTSGPLMAIDLNSDQTEDAVFATADRQLLAFDGKRGTRLAAADWFAESLLGAPVLCATRSGGDRVAVHSSAGKIALYDAQTLKVAGVETYHRTGTRGPASAYDVDGDGSQDLIMGDEEGHLLWLNPRSGILTVIEPAPSPPSIFPRERDTTRSIRSGVCGYDFDDDGRDDWVYRSPSGSVLICDGQGRILAGWEGPAMDSSAPVRATTPVLTDLDGKGPLEIIVAHPAGAVYAFQAPLVVPGALSVLWKASADDTIYDEVALADLTGDEVNDVVAVTRSGTLTMLDGRDGRALGSWPVGALGSPLIEDLNGDGLLEVMAPTDSAWAIIETGSKAYPGNTWPTWRGDAGRRGRRDAQDRWPPEAWWCAAAILMLTSAALWVKS